MFSSLSKIIATICMFGIISCQYFVNTTTCQVSNDIASSKKNGMFVAEYVADRAAVMQKIEIEEAWVERGWFSDIENNRVIKTKGDFCQLCFRVKQTKEPEFKTDAPLSWRIVEEHSGRYIHCRGDIYTVSLDDGNQETISLRLSVSNDTGWADRGIVNLDIKAETIDSSNVIGKINLETRIDVGF